MLSLIPKLLGLVVGLVGVFWLAILGAWGARHYDALTSVPGWHIETPGVIRIHFTLKPPHALWPEYVLAVEARDADAARAAATIAQRQQGAAATVQAKTVAALVRIEWRTRTLIQEIPSAISPAADRSFPLSVGFVRAHDAAALGVDLSAVARPAGQPDDAASSVAPSALAGLVADNYGACRADAAELAAWQDFYARLRAAQPANPAP